MGLLDKTNGLNKNKKVSLMERERYIPLSTYDIDNDKFNKNTRKKKNNQTFNIKVSESLKDDLDNLLKITNNKFYYQIIELAIETYIRNDLSEEQKKILKTLSTLK